MNFDHPGCFGLPSVVSASCRSCQQCPSRGDCIGEADALLADMPDNPLTQRERLSLSVTRQALMGTPPSMGRGPGQPGVVANARGVKRIVLTPSQLDEIGRMSSRVASQVRTLMEKGWFVYAKAEMLTGRNPGGKGWKKVLCGLLCAGGCTREQLELAFCEQLGMTPGSARMQVSAGMAIFAAGRLATECHGRITISPN